MNNIKDIDYVFFIAILGLLYVVSIINETMLG